MAYNQQFSSGDLSSIVIDGLGAFFVAIIAFASIFGLVMVYKYFKHGRVKF